LRDFFVLCDLLMKANIMELQNIPWDAISARLKDEADLDQNRENEEWLEESSENQSILAEIINTWSITKNKSEFYQPDMAINWIKLMDRIHYQPKISIFHNLYFRWAAAAAIIIIVFLTGLETGNRVLKTNSNISYTKIISPKGNKTQIILPDSSRVWLNSGSELSYSSAYSCENREVYMKGECFFEVAKDASHPFKVHGSRFQVKVFGTRFNVNEDERTDKADVILVSGKVTVLNLHEKVISKLAPGQQLVYSNGSYKIQKAENINAQTAWVNNMLIFDNQPFEEVIHYLEKWYGVKIQLDPNLYHNHYYTFKVKTESLREVLDLISVITPINYKIEGEKVTIKNKKR